MDIDSIYKALPTNNDCISLLEKIRWNGRPQCPYCSSNNATPAPKEKRYHCNNCNTAFSVTVKTIFHHTHLPFQKWFLAVSIVLNGQMKISARELGRVLKVNKNTGWRMTNKIQESMFKPDQRQLLTGIAEAYATNIRVNFR